MHYSVGLAGLGLSLIALLMEIRHGCRVIYEQFVGCEGAWDCSLRYFNLEDATFLGVNAQFVFLLLAVYAVVFFAVRLARQTLTNLKEPKQESESPIEKSRGSSLVQRDNDELI